MKQKMELRSVGVEFEAVNDDALMIEGKVNGLDWSKQLGERRRFIEKVDKGAFKRAIERSLENDKYIDLLGNHNKAILLASTQNDSLKLEEREDGLYMSANLIPTVDGKNYYELCKSGLFQEMSFGFYVPEVRGKKEKAETWERQSDGTFKRYIHELELSEVSIVRRGAYNNTKAQLQARGIDVVEEPDFGIEDDLLAELRSLTPEDLQKMISETVNAAFENYVKPENQVVEEVKVEEQPQEVVVEEPKTEEVSVNIALTDDVKQAIQTEIQLLKDEMLSQLDKKEDVAEAIVQEDTKKEPDTTEDKTAQDLTMYKEMLENLKEEEINE